QTPKSLFPAPNLPGPGISASPAPERGWDSSSLWGSQRAGERGSRGKGMRGSRGDLGFPRKGRGLLCGKEEFPGQGKKGFPRGREKGFPAGKRGLSGKGRPGNIGFLGHGGQGKEGFPGIPGARGFPWGKRGSQGREKGVASTGTLQLGVGLGREETPPPATSGMQELQGGTEGECPGWILPGLSQGWETTGPTSTCRELEPLGTCPALGGKDWKSLRDLGFSRLEKRRLPGDLLVAFQGLRGPPRKLGRGLGRWGEWED
ncbi:PREDICTED: collagen alpha-2(IV) chain-like, partial [Chaetura pelagica]|uniref:collagen alpha-2(IV) chain-like n=1 Tax=Chaetura pelagica TaxID=8897 RepID=UPI0005234EFE